ncbi:hypothetical protein PUN28_004842 [Cardiocondyla obscurior]|uniref:Uncharacterized protein n=1 Tax=Cardiocondyla obscurior TaxID=286306 RepID=A0AAW2GHI6_9HYME
MFGKDVNWIGGIKSRSCDYSLNKGIIYKTPRAACPPRSRDNLFGIWSGDYGKCNALINTATRFESSFLAVIRSRCQAENYITPREEVGLSLKDDIPFHRYPFRRSSALRSAHGLSYAAYTLWPGKLKFYSGITLRKRGATFENCYALRWTIKRKTKYGKCISYGECGKTVTRMIRKRTRDRTKRDYPGRYSSEY